MPDVVVVGGGHNGLTCAALLARAGLDVLVLERREVAGGAVATEELVPGFRFSTCAYALHLLHERVADALGLELDLLPSKEAVALLPDGTVARPDESGARALGVFDEWRAWDREWADAARLVDATLLGEPPSWEALAAETPLGRVSMNELLTAFPAEARTLFARAYFEGDPDEAGGPLAYAWVETSRCRDSRWQGVPHGGMGTVAAAFARAAERAGARVECGVAVADVEPGRARLADGTTIAARAVVVGSAPDTPQPATPPAAKLHLALSGRPDVSRLGYEPEELGVVHVHGADGVLVELQLPSLRDASLAPRGAHTLSIFVPRIQSDGSINSHRFAESCLDLAERALPGLRGLVLDVVVHDADALERRVGLSGGQIHHVPHVPKAMFDRRGGARTEVAGVYRCGASAHPGGEVSGVPGWNAAEAVVTDLAEP